MLDLGFTDGAGPHDENLQRPDWCSAKDWSRLTGSVSTQTMEKVRHELETRPQQWSEWYTSQKQAGIANISCKSSTQDV